MESKLEVIIDTDIGTDIDDAFAIAFAFRAHLDILGISTVSGDTCKRAAIISRMESIEGNLKIPIFAGSPSRAPLTYASWANGQEVHDIRPFDDMISFYWKCIHSARRETPLAIIALGPMTNLRKIRALDPETFDSSVRIYAMCGSIKKGYSGLPFPTPEYNIVADKDAARVIFTSNVPLTIVPLDVTWNLNLEKMFFKTIRDAPYSSDGLLVALGEMSLLFRKHIFGHRAPILFDVATVSTLVKPDIASFTRQPLHVSRLGFTRPTRKITDSSRNINVCIDLDKDAFFQLFFDVFRLPT